MRVFDGHCDTLLPLIGRSLDPAEREPRDFFAHNAVGQVDMPRLEAGGVACQVFACFAGDPLPPEGAFSITERLLDTLEGIVARSEGRLLAVRSDGELKLVLESGAVGALASVEGGECLDGDLDALRHFYARGVRMLGLTYNRRNELGRGVRAEGSDGLSAFGREVIRECARLGIIVDVSHLSDEGLRDALSCSDAPLVASHSNCRAYSSHVRNLRDDQILDIGRTGGLVAVNAVPYFVEQHQADATMGRLADHIERVARLAGIAAVGLGSDFDGYLPAGPTVDDASAWPGLEALLRQRGFGQSDVEKVFFENWRRVLKAVHG
jgi:membrane dipeptidase